MNNKFSPLDWNDDDVILLEKDTFKVSRLKELIQIGIANKLTQYTQNHQTKNLEGSILESLSNIIICQECIQLDAINFSASLTCHILQVGGNSWQKGTLKIQVNKSIVNKQLLVYLEFCFDQPYEPESPLNQIYTMMKS